MASSDDNNFLTETITSAKELITERFSSPFIFSLILSWLILNYKVVIIIFTDVSDDFSIQDKLCLINQSLLKSSFTIPFIDFPVLLNAFALPFVAACFYTFVYPFADYYITKFTLDRKVKVRNARISAEGKITYSQKDVQKIYLQNSIAEKELNARLANAEEALNQLRIINKDLEEKLDVTSKTKSLGMENTLENLASKSDQNKYNNIEVNLSLARGFIASKEYEKAKELLDQIKNAGNAEQRQLATTLLKNVNLNSVKYKFDELELNIVKVLGAAHNDDIEYVREYAIRDVVKNSNVNFNVAIENLVSKNIIDYKGSGKDGIYKLKSNGLKLFKELEDGLLKKPE